MKKRLTVAFPELKYLNLDDQDPKNIGNSKNKQKSENADKKFNLIGFLKKQRKNTLATINPMDELIEEISKDLQSHNIKDSNDDMFLANKLIENEKNHFMNGKIIKLVDIIFYILKKNQKNENEIMILKLYFLKMEKLVSLILPLKININDMLMKLVCQIKCEKRTKNTVLFKAGDIGEKLYILLKGNVGILITKEKYIECTPLEFVKYLILLHLYQEESLLNEIILKNKHNINIEEKAIMTLMHVFKFYYFLKENNRLTKYYKSIFDFIQSEHKLSLYIFHKFNYSPVLSLDILNYERTTVEQLYLFYARKIKEINKSLRFGLSGSALIANFIKRQIKPSLANKPQTQEELLNFLKPYDEGKKKFKNEEEYYQKISFVNEISHNKILSTSEDKYIERLDSEILLESIRQDTKNYVEDFDLISEQSMKFKVFVYYEINQLFDGNIFGELALSDPANKRTATIITKEDCYFGTLIKQVYDLSLKAAQEKLRLRNVLFFTRGPIFKGISNSIFLNKFFYTFAKTYYKKGDILFKRGEKRKSVIFVEKGELELSGNMSLYDITKLINLLGGILDDKYLNYICTTYYEFNKFYYNYKHNIKFCVLKDKEIIGLEDLVLDDINMFDCKCVSTDKTELYEIDYNTFKEANKYNQIRNNIINFVNTKRSIFIKMLLQQRNTLIINELNKIKKNQLKLGELINENSKNKNKLTKNLFLPITKNVKFSEKKIALSYNHKSKKGDDNLIKLACKNSKSFKKLEKSQNLNLLSTRDVDYEKNNSNRVNSTKFTLSDAGYKNNNNLLTTIKSYKTKNKNHKIQNHNNLKLKKSFFNRKTLYDSNNNNVNYNSINSTQEFNSINSKNINNITYFNKNHKPLVKKIFNSRTKKKLVPFLSYSNSKKVKGEITPIIFKEIHIKYPELRNNIDTNNFYIENQNIFDSLLYKDDNSRYKCKTERAKSKYKKIIINDKKLVYSYNTKDKEQNIEKNNSNEDSNNYISKSNNKANQTDNNFYKPIKPKKYYKYKEADIIDFLCLDKWEEKEHFQKNIFSEHNLF